VVETEVKVVMAVVEQMEVREVTVRMQLILIWI
jgi:hypothetical protein